MGLGVNHLVSAIVLYQLVCSAVANRKETKKATEVSDLVRQLNSGAVQTTQVYMQPQC